MHSFGGFKMHRIMTGITRTNRIKRDIIIVICSLTHKQNTDKLALVLSDNGIIKQTKIIKGEIVCIHKTTSHKSQKLAQVWWW